MSIWFEEAIPIHKEKFVHVLQSHMQDSEREAFAHFVKIFDFYISNKFQKVSNQLSIYYHPFNPDTTSPMQLTAKEEEEFAKILIAKFRQFLGQAQYREITEYEMQDILHQNHLRGLQSIVSPEKCRDFIVYFRDPFIRTEYRRSWRSFWLKKRAYNVLYYTRLVFLTRPFRKTPQMNKETQWEEQRRSLPQPISLKLFQNLSQEYLAIIFPGLYLKLPWQKKLYIALLSLLTLTMTSLSIWNLWFSIIAIISFLGILHVVYLWDIQKKQCYQNLLKLFYYNNVGNNHGVLAYLVERIEEETYKQQLLMLYACWQKKYWTASSISAKALQQYIQSFTLQYFGVKLTLNVENVLAELLLGEQDTEDKKSLIKSVQPGIHSLKNLTEPGAMYMDLAPSKDSILNAGIVFIAPNTTLQEIRTFTYDTRVLYLEHGLNFSHATGAAVRWFPETPFQTKLAVEAFVGQSEFTIDKENIEMIPLQGIGKINTANSQIEFRYHRQPNSCVLQLDTGLRYRHIPTPEHPVFVRPILPCFTTTEEVKATSIFIPNNLCFPENGLVKIQSKDELEIQSYHLIQENGDTFLSLDNSLKETYPMQTKISLTPPSTQIQKKVARGSLFLPVASTKFFNMRGLLILAADTETEERITLQGETVKLSLTNALQFRHNTNSIVQLKDSTIKSKIILNAPKNTKQLIVQAFSEDITEGELILDPGEKNQEICTFKIVQKFFELTAPTKFIHYPDEEVIEASLESPLKYGAFQGNHIITVEDATHFPLKGKLEIHFNGVQGVKEVFPFVRTECSNTLLLPAQIKEYYPENTPILIHAVEVTTEASFYKDKILHVDFSCVPDFPTQGTLILEPGSQMEEIVSFQRFPERIYFNKALEFLHSIGTTLDFSHYMQTPVKKSISSNAEKICLDFQSLLPEQGSLYIDYENKIDIVWYNKHQHRVLLLSPCRFHHKKGEQIFIHHLNSELTLATSVQKGMQEIKLVSAQDLPKRGIIHIESLFHSVSVEFVRNEDTLYLKEPLPFNFSSHAHLSIPDIFLQNHLVPGMDYIDVTNIDTLPERGEFIFGFNTSKEELIPFHYQPDILWINPPLLHDYPAGTMILSPELMAKGSNALSIIPLSQALEQIQTDIATIYSKNPSNSQTISKNLLDITQEYYLNVDFS